jgi:hypothetical protein
MHLHGHLFGQLYFFKLSQYSDELRDEYLRFEFQQGKNSFFLYSVQTGSEGHPASNQMDWRQSGRSTRLHLVSRLRVELYLHFRIRLHGVVFKGLSKGVTSPRLSLICPADVENYVI